MLDDLDLAWEEHEPRRRGGPPTRQARQRRRKEKKRRRRSFLALFISAVLLAGLGLGVYVGVGWVQDTFGTPDYTDNPATTAVLVTIDKGDSSSQIAAELYAKKVVKSTKAFIKVAQSRPDDAKKIQPGVYKLFEQMPASAAFAMLLDPEKNKQVFKVPVPEGMISFDIYAKISKATGVPVADFVEAAKDPVALGVDPAWFTAPRQDGRQVIKSVEGFLYPATYEFAPGMTAKQMLSEMVDKFNEVTADLHFADTVKNNLGITPYEALIAASIAQAEAVNKEDFAKVARVLYNRAYSGNFPCACMQLDSEVNYYLRSVGKDSAASEHLTQAQLHDPNDPYNTHDKPGLPPGAISNPGEDALGGAMAPVGDKTVFYFMTIDKQGTMGYAKTAAQFQQLVSQACKNGIPLCS